MTKYIPKNVCARLMEVSIDGDTVKDVRIHGGCPGQTKALPSLIKGMKVEEAIRRLRGVKCRSGTSCADQLGRILEHEMRSIRDKSLILN